jgi:NADH-quinone oxidoreductase subunit J
VSFLFYLSAVVAVIATLLVVVAADAVHALLYLIVSLWATAVMFFILGAPFVAAVVVIINAGAIVILFVFAVWMLSLKPDTPTRPRPWLSPRTWLGPVFLASILIAELVYCGLWRPEGTIRPWTVDPEWIGMELFGPYLLASELAAFLLLAGVLGAFHMGRPAPGGRGL